MPRRDEYEYKKTGPNSYEVGFYAKRTKKEPDWIAEITYKTEALARHRCQWMNGERVEQPPIDERSAKAVSKLLNLSQ